jgi:hypothetical protein
MTNINARTEQCKDVFLRSYLVISSEMRPKMKQPITIPMGIWVAAGCNGWVKPTLSSIP